MGTRSLGEETVAAIEAGGYTAPSGAWVPLRAAVDAAVAGTKLYRPGHVVEVARSTGSITRETPIFVTGETTSAAAARLVEAANTEREPRALPVTVLCFASAKNLGGGFLGGAKAQEEDLARASALYACQRANPAFYQANRATKSMLYTDHLLWSPAVPFFRDDAHRWLETPFLASVITAPAPNAGEAKGRDEETEGPARVRAALWRRGELLLRMAAFEAPGTDVVLGAWGCGVFRNEPREVATMFRELLLGTDGTTRYLDSFSSVTFAVWARREPNVSRAVFEEVLSAR